VTQHTEGNAPGVPALTGTVEHTPSGLGFIDEQPGTGASPQPGQSVAVHYTGWLTTGKKFDSSRDRGQPFTFVLGRGQVIRGWDEGVAAMKVGGKRRLILPAALGYGANGSPPVIPPNSTLIFDVELISVK
jgi:peptidylprolyl isomerase